MAREAKFVKAKSKIYSKDDTNDKAMLETPIHMNFSVFGGLSSALQKYSLVDALDVLVSIQEALDIYDKYYKDPKKCQDEMNKFAEKYRCGAAKPKKDKGVDYYTFDKKEKMSKGVSFLKINTSNEGEITIGLRKKILEVKDKNGNIQNEYTDNKDLNLTANVDDIKEFILDLKEKYPEIKEHLNKNNAKSVSNSDQNNSSSRNSFSGDDESEKDSESVLKDEEDFESLSSNHNLRFRKSKEDIKLPQPEDINLPDGYKYFVYHLEDAKANTFALADSKEGINNECIIGYYKGRLSRKKIGKNFYIFPIGKGEFMNLDSDKYNIKINKNNQFVSHGLKPKENQNFWKKLIGSRGTLNKETKKNNPAYKDIFTQSLENLNQDREQYNLDIVDITPGIKMPHPIKIKNKSNIGESSKKNVTFNKTVQYNDGSSGSLKKINKPKKKHYNKAHPQKYTSTPPTKIDLTGQAAQVPRLSNESNRRRDARMRGCLFCRESTISAPKRVRSERAV